jgi:hypothetical protein
VRFVSTQREWRESQPLPSAEEMPPGRPVLLGMAAEPDLTLMPAPTIEEILDAPIGGQLMISGELGPRS